MFTSIQLSQKNDPNFSSSVSELFQSTSRTLIYAIGAIYFGAILATAIWPEQIAVNVWIVVPLSIAFLFFSLWLLPRIYLLAHILLQVGVAGSILLSVFLFQKSELAYFLVLLPLISIICLGWKTGSVMQLFVICVVYWMNHGLLLIPPSLTLSIVIIVGGVISGLIGWASMQAVLTVTEWSIYSFKQSQENLKDAREHRGKLAHVVKELDSANIHLEKLNHMLVLARVEAEEAKDARNRFALAISHELRTPLNFIISFSEIMVKSPQTYGPLTRWPNNLYEDVQEIYRSSQHLMRLVNDVLDLGQIENLRMTLIKEWISLAQIIEEVRGMMHRSFELKKVELHTEIEPDLPIVFVDRTRIRQVLLNLVNNSLRFTDQGSVTIRLGTHEEGSLLICVSDTGTGISEQDISRIFEDFQQATQDSWRRREGTGLGIPISKRFVELHGGKMWVASQIGQGTRFYFSIPIISSRSDQNQLDQERDEKYWKLLKENAEKGKNILVISNDPAAGDIIAPYIEGARLVTLPPGSDETFSDTVANLMPQAVFLDEQIAGDEWTFSGLRAIAYDLPVLSFRFPGNPLHPTDLPSNVRYYLVKPFSNQILRDAILSLGEGIRNLVVVDDDPSMFNLVKRILMGKSEDLTSRPLNILWASTGQSALDLMDKIHPDAILLDVKLPDMSGLDVLQKTQQQDIPVIFITAYEWPHVSAPGEMDVLRIQMRRPLNRDELTQMLKVAVETIRPNYPINATGLIPSSNRPG